MCGVSGFLHQSRKFGRNQADKSLYHCLLWLCSSQIFRNRLCTLRCHSNLRCVYWWKGLNYSKMSTVLKHQASSIKDRSVLNYCLLDIFNSWAKVSGQSAKATNSEDEPWVYLMQIPLANGFRTSFVRWLSIRINSDASSGPGPVRNKRQWTYIQIQIHFHFTFYSSVFILNICVVVWKLIPVSHLYVDIESILYVDV